MQPFSACVGRPHDFHHNLNKVPLTNDALTQTTYVFQEASSHSWRRYVTRLGHSELTDQTGAAGMSCAATLMRHPSKFEVTLVEKQTFCGGQATSIDIDNSRYGADFLNDGVQGGSGIFAHTFRFFKEQGFEASPVGLQISFGKGEDGFWSNVFSSKLISQYKKEIEKFGKMLKWMRRFEIIFALFPIWLSLKLFRFSTDFGDKMVYPLMALFLGTGNQTPYVSSAILERLFTDDNMKLWDYSPDTLLPNLPEMFTFPHLSNFYSTWRSSLEKAGVQFRNGHEVFQVVKRSSKGVTVKIQPVGVPEDAVEESFDDMVLAILADDAKRLLGSEASWLERNVLGSAKFFDDITVTHNDMEYMDKYYENVFDKNLASTPNNKKQEEQLEFANSSFKPMYYTHSYPEDRKRIEMTFDCTNYQHQFPKDVPRDRHVFQTIYLDKSHGHLWTKDEVNKDKIIKEKWWHQLGHNWTHYCKVVPWMMFLNGKHHTYFAGSWTLVNMHELAVISGMTVAYRLGAEYPFNSEDEEFGFKFFKLYLLLSHGTRYKPRS